MTQEQIRLQAASKGTSNWRKWGPYLSERAWGTVREDYSADGNAWDYFTHDHAREITGSGPGGRITDRDVVEHHHPRLRTMAVTVLSVKRCGKNAPCYLSGSSRPTITWT